jgi:hypothetical protein
MPYFCLRVPTGGGKTWLAAKSVALVNTHLLRCEHSVILWLVPSKPIREQTLRALWIASIPTTPRCARRADHGDGSRRGQERDPRHAGHLNLDHRRHAAGVSGRRRRVPQGVPVQRRADAPLRQPVARRSATSC